MFHFSKKWIFSKNLIPTATCILHRLLPLLLPLAKYKLDFVAINPVLLKWHNMVYNNAAL